jgi:hypothetical protein
MIKKKVLYITESAREAVERITPSRGQKTHRAGYNFRLSSVRS